MQFLRLLILFYESPKTGSHASKVKKYFSFLKKCIFIYLISNWFVNNSCEAVRNSSLSKPLFSVSPRWIQRLLEMMLTIRKFVLLCLKCFTLWTGKLFARTWADIMQMCYFVTYSYNRIRFEFLTNRLGDSEQTFFLIDNFIYRALSASQLCREFMFTYSYMTHCMKGNIRKGIIGAL